MSQKLNTLIENYSNKNLIRFFKDKLPSSFINLEENYTFILEKKILWEEKFTNLVLIGRAELPGFNNILVISAISILKLSSRGAKKDQFEIAKEILLNENSDGAFFIFYDTLGNFRFSFIRVNYNHSKQIWSDFNRYSYYVSPNQSNSTFISQINKCNFQDLDSIIEAFNVEPLNKDFYENIAHSFYRLLGGSVENKKYDSVLKLPYLQNNEENKKKYQEFSVRLIGRLVFVWFLKNKTSKNGIPLIPMEWLTPEFVKKNKSYYHSIIEKLFFELLNKSSTERANDLPEDYDIVPFLNGGLFEPLEEDYYKPNNIMFSKLLVIPNDWFIEFFEVLERYNFTIDENSINDQEVSVDPEMLGTIFENLLAEINPETGETARKSTGSFYTPRVIVDHMVEDSLINYLSTKVTEEKEKLRLLFRESYISVDDFNNISKIIDAFDNVKVLDPACGSGAFPMSILHKINIALQKLDPTAHVWKQKQLQRFHGNSNFRKELEKKLDNSDENYIRKLGIIQNSIFGVDIQSIATEITKLRTFLSLIVDERVIDNPNCNRGIEPLPNLEFKFVTANTLSSLPTQKEKSSLLDITTDVKILSELREEYLNSCGNKKEKIKKKYKQIQSTIFRDQSSLFGDNKSRAYKLSTWDPFSHKPSEWFDSNWMFGVEGFNIVIGNPPYIGEKKFTHLLTFLKNNSDWKNFYRRRSNLYYFFFKAGIDLLANDGILTYITPREFLTADWANKLRNYITDNTVVLKLLDFDDAQLFENASISSLISFIKKSETTNKYIFEYSRKKDGESYKTDFIDIMSTTSLSSKDLGNDGTLLWSFNNTKKNNMNNCYPLGELFKVSQGIVTGADKVTSNNTNLSNDNRIGLGIYILKNEVDIRERSNNLQININNSWVNLENEDFHFIKPYISSVHLKRWNIEETKDFMIYIKTSDRVSPRILTYLSQFKDILINRSKIDKNEFISPHKFDNYTPNEIKSKYSSAGSVQKVMKSGKWYLPLYNREKVPFESTKIIVNTKLINSFSFSDSPIYTSGGGLGGQNIIYPKQSQNLIYLERIKQYSNIKDYMIFLTAILSSSILHDFIYTSGFNQLSTSKLSNLPIYKLDFANKYEYDKYFEIVALCKDLIKDTSNIAKYAKVDFHIASLYKYSANEYLNILMTLNKPYVEEAKKLFLKD